MGSVHEYQVACISVLPIELDAITGMLDEVHKGRPLLFNESQNAYAFGTIGEHRIVIARTTQCGNTTAAVVTTQLVNDFPSIKFCFLVGIGGGGPGEKKKATSGLVMW